MPIRRTVSLLIITQREYNCGTVRDTFNHLIRHASGRFDWEAFSVPLGEGNPPTSVGCSLQPSTRSIACILGKVRLTLPLFSVSLGLKPRAEQRLGHGVVPAITLASHRAFHMPVPQELAVIVAGILGGRDPDGRSALVPDAAGTRPVARHRPSARHPSPASASCAGPSQSRPLVG
jgi:hypothetical protein